MKNTEKFIEAPKVYYFNDPDTGGYEFISIVHDTESEQTRQPVNCTSKMHSHCYYICADEIKINDFNLAYSCFIRRLGVDNAITDILTKYDAEKILNSYIKTSGGHKNRVKKAQTIEKQLNYGDEYKTDN